MICHVPAGYKYEKLDNTRAHSKQPKGICSLGRMKPFYLYIMILHFEQRMEKKPIFDNSVCEFRCEFFECVLTIFRTADYTRNTYIIRNSMTCIADKRYVDQMTVFGNTFTYIMLYYTILYIRIIIVCVTPYVLTSSDPFYWKTSVVKVFFSFYF